MGKKIAVIIGAGPAGLTAAYELVTKTDIKPIVCEAGNDIGGISKTVEYKGNRIDIGGHRFFSKSDTIMQWWQSILPLQGAPSIDDIALGRVMPFSRKPDAPDPEKTDRVMLLRKRLSRIFYLKKFFNYPISINLDTLSKLGFFRLVAIGLSYINSRLHPIKEERSLEDFFINRFGKRLYLTFFKDYTEKVWGIPCDKIKPEWGLQRIKGLSVTKVLLHALKSAFSKTSDVSQKNTETSLIQQFMYPKFGPGQLWGEVARIVTEKGGEIHLGHRVISLSIGGGRISEVSARNEATGNMTKMAADYVFSTMPVKDFIGSLKGNVPADVLDVAEGLRYRSLVTVGILLKRLKIKNDTNIKTINNIIPDNWIYVQERDVKLGRIQIFNNWSPYMVKDRDTVWIGLEYFCDEGDSLWRKSDAEFKKFAIEELTSIGFIDSPDVMDSTVIRMPKTYPVYYGSYEKFDLVRKFIDGLANTFMIGRNGMHKYNNMDHSMLTAITAVENLIEGIDDKKNIWDVNTEKDYHEDAKS